MVAIRSESVLKRKFISKKTIYQVCQDTISQSTASMERTPKLYMSALLWFREPLRFDDTSGAM